MAIKSHQRFSLLQTTAFGPVLIGNLTLDAIDRLRPLVQSKDISDETLAQRLFDAVVRLPDPNPSVQARRLSDQESVALTRADLDAFAVGFMKHKNWDAKTGEQLTDIGALASALKSEIARMDRQIHDLSEKISANFKPLNHIFSDHTKALFAQSALISKTIQKLAGVAPAHAATVHASRFLEPTRLPDLGPSKADRSVIELNQKAEKAMEIVAEIANMIATTQEAVLSGAADFAQKRVEDKRSATKSIVWAIVALVATAAFSLAALLQDYVSNRSNEAQQQQIEDLLRQQELLLRDLVKLSDRERLLEERIRALEAVANKRAARIGPARAQPKPAK